MKNIDQILKNEFYSKTYQELRDFEKEVLDDYIEYYYQEGWTLDDLKNCVADFITDCFYTNPDYDPEIDCADNDEYILADCSHYPMSKQEVFENKIRYTYKNETVEKFILK